MYTTNGITFRETHYHCLQYMSGPGAQDAHSLPAYPLLPTLVTAVNCVHRRIICKQRRLHYMTKISNATHGRDIKSNPDQRFFANIAPYRPMRLRRYSPHSGSCGESLCCTAGGPQRRNMLPSACCFAHRFIFNFHRDDLYLCDHHRRSLIINTDATIDPY